MKANLLIMQLDLDPKLAEKNDDLDEFSLQLSLILMGNRSKEVQTLTQLLYVPLSDNEAKGKEVLGFSCTTTHILRPSFSGLHTVQYFENGYMSLLKQSELTSLLIQHNQSPDTSIFTLHPNSGSKVRRERGRRKREREREISEGTLSPRYGAQEDKRKTVEGMTRS